MLGRTRSYIFPVGLGLSQVGESLRHQGNALFFCQVVFKLSEMLDVANVCQITNSKYRLLTLMTHNLKN